MVLDLVSEGAVTLTAVRLLAPHLRPGNHRDVLGAARHKSKREVEEIVAGLNPRPEVASTIRKLPTPSSPEPATAPTGRAEGVPIAPESAAPEAVPTSTEIRRPHRTEVKPVAVERYKIQFTVGRQTYEKLRHAQNLLRHSVPDGDPAVIFDRALTLLVSELDRRQTGAVRRPRNRESTDQLSPRSSSNKSRHIPSAVQRAVRQRDGGQCAFRGRQGRCAETGFLEYHHVVPFAAGGDASANNIELRCRAHNGYEADLQFHRTELPWAREQPAAFGSTEINRPSCWDGVAAAFDQA